MSDEKVVLEENGFRVLANGMCMEQWPDGEWRETLNDTVPGMLARALAESEAKRVEAEALAEERDNAHAQQAQRVRDAEADNAALLGHLVAMREQVGHAKFIPDAEAEPKFLAYMAAGDALREPHPGSALLERVARLEEALRTIARWDTEGVERLPTERNRFRQLALNALGES